MKATNIPAYPSLDKFVFAVLNYMETHKFTKVPDYQEIELQADREIGRASCRERVSLAV